MSEDRPGSREDENIGSLQAAWQGPNKLERLSAHDRETRPHISVNPVSKTPRLLSSPQPCNLPARCMYP